METRRLRILQKPSEVQKQLEEVVLNGDLLPKGCYQIRDPSALPASLQVLVVRSTQDGRVWSCWANTFDTWLFTCEMSLSRSREHGVPVLLVNRYDQRGELENSSSWMSDSKGKWLRCHT